jgi:succinyl-CoA synthetase alpha subunit
LQALNEGIKLLVIITEFVPVMDALKIVDEANKLGARVVGPNTIGVISPGKSKLGIMPDYIYGEGHIGIISRSGTLTHETASNLTFKGYGLSTCVGIGGDSIIGMNHADVLELFAEDDETDAIVLIGEIGGCSEELAAAKIKELNLQKPVCAYIAGMYAPENKKMGHAGAIVSGGMGTVKSKVEALKDAGVVVCPTLGKIVEFMEEYNARTNGRLKSLEPRID